MIQFRIVVATIDVLLGLAALWVLFLATKQGPGFLPSEWRRRAGNIFIGIAGFVLLGSGSLKFAHVPEVVNEMTSLGLAGWKLNLVASLEVLSGLLFVLRPLRSLGLLIASAYLGAAICAHVQSDQYLRCCRQWSSWAAAGWVRHCVILRFSGV